MHLDLQWFGVDADIWLKALSLVGAAFVWLWERRRVPRLEAFFTHGAAHAIPSQQGPIAYSTHALVVRNMGYAPAVHVRVTHSLIPQNTTIQVWPQVPHTTLANPPNGSEIVFERLRPKEQIQLSYLYPSGPTIDRFGTMVRFDDGAAEWFQIQHARLSPTSIRMLVYYLLFAGLVLTLYLVMKAAVYLFVVA